MKYKRCFTFGCSFTNFFWPTYPDIIERDLGIPTQNWGLCGQGNVGIYHRMLEADLKYNFTDEDLIIVVWSTWHREDRFIKGSWTLNGNIFVDTQMYDKRFRKKYWDSENDIIKNSTAIINASRLYPISYQAKLKGSIETSGNFIYNNSRVLNVYAKHLPNIEDFPWDYQGDGAVNFDGALEHIDNHPDIKGHLHFVKDYIYPSLDLKIKDETVDYYSEMHDKIVELGRQGRTKKEIKEWQDIGKFFEKHIGYKEKRFGI